MTNPTVYSFDVPAVLTFQVTAPTEDAARAALAELSTNGLTVDVDATPDPGGPRVLLHQVCVGDDPELMSD